MGQKNTEADKIVLYKLLNKTVLHIAGKALILVFHN